MKTPYMYRTPSANTRKKLAGQSRVSKEDFICGLGFRDPATRYGLMESRIIALLGATGLTQEERDILQRAYYRHQSNLTVSPESRVFIDELAERHLAVSGEFLDKKALKRGLVNR